MLWVLLGSLLVILSLLCVIVWQILRNDKKTESLLSSNQSMIQNLMKQNQELFNRTQAKDLPAYLAMTHSTNYSENQFEDGYYPQDDESKYGRLVQAAGGEGSGEMLMDDASTDEFIEMANEIGIELKRDTK